MEGMLNVTRRAESVCQQSMVGAPVKQLISNRPAFGRSLTSDVGIIESCECSYRCIQNPALAA